MKESQVEAFLNAANAPELEGAGYIVRVTLTSGAQVDMVPVGIVEGCLYQQGDGGGGPGLVVDCAAIAALEFDWQ